MASRIRLGRETPGSETGTVLSLAARPVAGSDRDRPRRPRQGRNRLRWLIKENIRVEGKRDIQTKVMTTLFALFAEVERDPISEHTREGLARAKSSGRKLGRPKGSLGVSRLDGKEDEIRRLPRAGRLQDGQRQDHRSVPDRTAF